MSPPRRTSVQSRQTSLSKAPELQSGHMRFTAAAAASLAALAVPICLAANSISRVTVSSVAHDMHIALDARQPFRFNLFSLHNPERVLLDLEGISPNAQIDGIAASIRAEPASLLIRSIRTHRTGAHSTRIELSFDGEVEPAVSAQRIDGAYRVLLTLHPERAGTIPTSPLPAPPPKSITLS